MLTLIERTNILGKDLNIYGNKDNPLFLAKDIANWIEHNNPRMMINNL